MGEKVDRTGRKVRPKTAEPGKRYLCARCRKRSPQAVFGPAPWYCPKCVPPTDGGPPANPAFPPTSERGRSSSPTPALPGPHPPRSAAEPPQG